MGVKNRTGECVRCSRLKYLKGRGLCDRCWADPAVRAAHPPRPDPRTNAGRSPRCKRCGVRAAGRGPGKALCQRCYTTPGVLESCRPPPPPVPDEGPVDESDRIAVMAARAKLKLPLFTKRRPPAWRV